MSVRHIRTAEFKKCYGKLSQPIQESADKQFKLLKENPQHPSWQFRQLSSRSDCWYARVTDNYRALATRYQNVYIWFWIGTKAKFQVLTARPKNLGPTNLPSDQIKQQQEPFIMSFVSVSGLQGSSQPSTEDVNPVELDNLIQEAISDFNEDKYEEWR